MSFAGNVFKLTDNRDPAVKTQRLMVMQNSVTASVGLIS